jgi:hypothetical protein
MIKSEEKILVDLFFLTNKGKRIDRVEVEGIWYFSLIDLIEIIISPSDSRDYLKKVKKRNELLKNLYPSLVTDSLLPSSKINKTLISASNFNILLSFIASPKLDRLKNYIDNKGVGSLEGLLVQIATKLDSI